MVGATQCDDQVRINGVRRVCAFGVVRRGVITMGEEGLHSGGAHAAFQAMSDVAQNTILQLCHRPRGQRVRTAAAGVDQHTFAREQGARPAEALFLTDRVR